MFDINSHLTLNILKKRAKSISLFKRTKFFEKGVSIPTLRFLFFRKKYRIFFHDKLKKYIKERSMIE